MTDAMEYSELICRTNFSFLEGGSHASELVERAATLGLRALAITDRDGVYAIPRAFTAAKAHPALKLITGARVTVRDRPPVTLLAADRAGYGLLCRALTAAHAGKPKGESALEPAELLSFLEEPAARGLIALIEPGEGALCAEIRERLDDRAFLPLARRLDGRDRARTERLLELSRRYGLPLVATNDVHYHHPDRRRLQDVLTAARLNTTLEGAGRRLFANAERHLKGAAEMAALFSDLPEAVRRTVEIAERCSFSPSELRYRYPSEWIPAGETAQSWLTRLTWQGAAGRYPGGVPDDARKQLNHELKLVEELQFADYFLTIWEIVDFARQRGILCQGRGSAANSAICYCLGITAVDPVRMNLLFERFLSAERGEPPDIDVDFEHERREEVIQHLYEKYGRHRAAMVSAVVTYRSRLAAREVKKALALPLHEGREDAWESLPEAERPLADAARELADELRGFPRHLSIHSGGFTLSADPIVEIVPVEPARMEGRTIIQWDKYDLDALGLLKVDVLALGMLSALRKCLELVNAKPGAPEPRPLTLATIPAEDVATYRMIQRADTVGVFQIESRAQMSMLPRLLPKTFYDLVVEVALVRPGPIVGKMVHPYLRRRKGLEDPRSPDPRLEPILGRTLGVPLFQEQVMKMAITMANFTPGEADQLRRAIGAWRSSGSIEKMGRKLQEGLLASGLPLPYVELIFEQIRGFAEYGFPESHAASFALLAYASSYLKCHHPAEFACSLLNSQPMGFYAPHTLIDDAKRHGARVLPIDPNHSDWDCRMEGPALRLGFRVVHGLPEVHAERLLAARAERPFASFGDFLRRSGLRADALQRLAMGDAFAGFGLSQRDALWAILALAAHRPRAEATGQLSLFGGETDSAPRPTVRFRELGFGEAIEAEYAAFGLSLKGHPMAALRRELRARSGGRGGAAPDWVALTSATAKRRPSGARVRVGGLTIVRQRPPTANGTMFATLEDEDGFLDLVLRPEVHERCGETFLTHSFLIAEGVVQRDGTAVSLLVKRILPIAQSLDTCEGPLAPPSRDFR